MDSNQAFNQIVLFSGFEYHRALEYLKERGFFFCAKLEKNPKCPELWMATTHPLMIDWNKGNDGEYYSMFPKDFSHPEFDYQLVDNAMRQVLGTNESLKDESRYNCPQAQAILTRKDVTQKIVGWVRNRLISKGYCPDLAIAFEIETEEF